MKSSSKSILIILPKLTNYGGLQIENIGFINALAESSIFNVNVLTVDIDSELKSLINNKVIFHKLNLLSCIKCLSIWFIKILIKTKFNFSIALRIYLERKPFLLKTFLTSKTKANDVVFCSSHPQSIVSYVQNFCNENQRQFVFHQISEPHPKYIDFYKSLTQKDVILISSENKYEKINQINSKPSFKKIKQWIYTKENEFLKLKPKLNNNVSFGLVCRLDKEKNINLVLKASKLIKENNFKIVIYGEGYELDNLKKMADKRNLSKKVIFKGSLDFNNRYKAYQDIDVFLCSSWSEGGPITILEAMAAGLPVISTNVGDVKNRIINKHNGFILLNNDDEFELSQLMLNYLNNIGLIETHGKNGRKRYKKEYHSKIVKELFLNQINECFN